MASPSNPNPGAQRLKHPDFDYGISEASITRSLVSLQGLHGFVREFWGMVEPAHPFVDNWHIGAVCEHLTAVSDRQIKRLVINQPPGTMKSLSVGVFWPAWVYGVRDPAHKWMNLSYDEGLVLRDASRMLDIMQSALFKAAFPAVTMNKVNRMREIWTEQGGLRFSTTFRGKGTGWHVNTQVVDDPSKPDSQASKTPTEMRSVIDKWDGIFANRRAEPVEDFARLVVMQRLHEADLAGHCLDNGYEHLCLPMRYEPKCQWDRGSQLNRDQSIDPRTEKGELLYPQRYSEATVKNLEQELGTPSAVSSQNEQNPMPTTGSFFEMDWFSQTYTELPAQTQFLQIRQYWDLAAKAKKEAHSRCAGLLAAWFGGKFYPLDIRVGHFNYPQAKKIFLETQSQGLWSKASKIWIEDKANGTPLLDDLPADGVTLPLYGYEPKGSKEDRAAVQSDKCERGLVVFPSEALGTWPREMKDEIVRFPNAKHDDLLDVFVMMLEDLGHNADRAKKIKKGLARFVR